MTATDPPGADKPMRTGDRRRRAPAMAPEERRQMIVAAALPLVLEHGPSVTTAQIARAAGVAEGTLFRAFHDKGELLAECFREAVHPDDEIARLCAEPADLPVRDRLLGFARSAGTHLGRMARLVHALDAWEGSTAGPPSLVRERIAAGPIESDEGMPDEDMADEDMDRLVAALATALEPGAERLRYSCADVARVFIGLVFVNHIQRRLWGGAPLEPEILTDLFLGGVEHPLPETATDAASA
jgi:AcrR family transcriptional regulator